MWKRDFSMLPYSAYLYAEKISPTLYRFSAEIERKLIETGFATVDLTKIPNQKSTLLINLSVGSVKGNLNTWTRYIITQFTKPAS